MTKRFKVVSVKECSSMQIKDPYNISGRECTVATEGVHVGGVAYMLFDDLNITTSTIKDVLTTERGMHIQTLNTIYYLEEVK